MNGFIADNGQGDIRYFTQEGNAVTWAGTAGAHAPCIIPSGAIIMDNSERLYLTEEARDAARGADARVTEGSRYAAFNTADGQFIDASAYFPGARYLLDLEHAQWLASTLNRAMKPEYQTYTVVAVKFDIE